LLDVGVTIIWQNPEIQNLESHCDVWGACERVALDIFVKAQIIMAPSFENNLKLELS
jgi:hypothetical protein